MTVVDRIRSVAAERQALVEEHKALGVLQREKEIAFWKKTGELEALKRIQASEAQKKK